jgi:hypothetical protein
VEETEVPGEKQRPVASHCCFSPGTSVSSTSKIDRHDITEIVLKVALNTINQPTTFYF